MHAMTYDIHLRYLKRHRVYQLLNNTKNTVQNITCLLHTSALAMLSTLIYQNTIEIDLSP